MLNRRLLRIKAMQNIYAFNQSRETDRLLIIDELKQKFHEELLLEGVMEKNRIADEEKQVIDFFEANYEQVSPDFTVLKKAKLVDMAEKAIDDYHHKVNTSIKNIESRMLVEVNLIAKHYLKFLHTLVLIAEHAEDTYQKKTKRVLADAQEKAVYDIFSQNTLIKRISGSKNFRLELERNKVHSDLETARVWYKVLVAKINNLSSEENNNEEEPSEFTPFQADKKQLRDVVRSVLFKDDQVTNAFEEADINWEENRNVLKSMVTKTIKDVEETETEVELLALSRNWEDDQKFFKILFNKTIDFEKEHEASIVSKSEKWKKERIARLDQIILQIALTEMREFPSIPVKVTINEYIEISKQYSTPKSWQYINGMLDAISKEMLEKGAIKKSGRGLIDNR